MTTQEARDELALIRPGATIYFLQKRAASRWCKFFVNLDGHIVNISEAIGVYFDKMPIDKSQGTSVRLFEGWDWTPTGVIKRLGEALNEHVAFLSCNLSDI